MATLDCTVDEGLECRRSYDGDEFYAYFLLAALALGA